MSKFYIDLLDWALCADWITLAVAAVLAVLASVLPAGRWTVRSVRRLLIWLDEEERARVALHRRRLLQEYNRARDEEQECKAAIHDTETPADIHIKFKTLKNTIQKQRK